MCNYLHRSRRASLDTVGSLTTEVGINCGLAHVKYMRLSDKYSTGRLVWNIRCTVHSVWRHRQLSSAASRHVRRFLGHHPLCHRQPRPRFPRPPLHEDAPLLTTQPTHIPFCLRWPRDVWAVTSRHSWPSPPPPPPLHQQLTRRRHVSPPAPRSPLTLPGENGQQEAVRPATGVVA